MVIYFSLDISWDTWQQDDGIKEDRGKGGVWRRMCNPKILLNFWALLLLWIFHLITIFENLIWKISGVDRMVRSIIFLKIISF